MVLLKPSRLTAVLLILLAGAGFSVITALIKLLSANLHPFQIAFLRTFLGMVWLMPLLARRPMSFSFLSDHFPLHLLRAVSGILAMGCGFYALSILPLALVTTLGFTTPLWMIGLAWFFLGERPNWPTRLATISGFAGILIINPLMADSWSWEGTTALCSPFFEAVVLISIKRLTTTEPILNIIATYGVLASLFWLPVAVWVWQPLSGHDLLLMAFVAGIATLGQAATINAYAMAPATVVSPFHYVRLVFVVMIGFLFFQEIPTWTTLLGATIIVGGNLLIVKSKG
ncbi:MAG: hypothetical protein HW380_2239 [Magnetococcales bacterium]|nr:hypothetical protein [Magnetococcales bacterium]